MNVQQWVTDKMQILDDVSSKLLLPCEERRWLWCISAPIWALGCPHRSFTNYIILGGAVYTKRGRFARKGQMAMVLSLFSFMWWEYLPKLWETTTITTILIERVSKWWIDNISKQYWSWCVSFPQLSFTHLLYQCFFFPPSSYVLVCSWCTYKMKPWGYIDVEMLLNGVWQYEIYMTHGPPNFLIWETWWRI